MFVVDLERRILAVNDAATVLAGRSADALIGERFSVVLDDPAEAPDDARWRAQVLRGESSGRRPGAAARRLDAGHRVRAACRPAGGSVLVLGVCIRERAGGGSERPHEPAPLTRREREIVRLIALGETTPQICAALFIAPDTVRSHVRNAMAKTGARTRAQLIAIALTEGLLDDDDGPGAEGVQPSDAPTACSMSPCPFEDTDCRYAGSGGGLGRVQAALELAQHEAEQEVAPRRLGERAPVARELRQLVARRVALVDEDRQRPGREVLGEPGGRAARPGGQRHRGRHVRVRRPEQRAVGDVHRDADRMPRPAAGHRLAEQLLVEVGHAEDPLVERRLGGPHAGRDGARERAAGGPSDIHAHGVETL